MITKIAVMLDYGCYPVWLYDENGFVEDTLLPEELRGDLELDAKFDDLQSRYDALFVDNRHEFSYVGFKSDHEKELFVHDWTHAVKELKNKLGERYEFVDMTSDVLALDVAPAKNQD